MYVPQTLKICCGQTIGEGKSRGEPQYVEGGSFVSCCWQLCMDKHDGDNAREPKVGVFCQGANKASQHEKSSNKRALCGARNSSTTRTVRGRSYG